MGKNKEKLNIFLLHFLERLNSNEPNERKVIESLTDFCNYYDFTKGFIYQTDGFRYFLLKETIGNEGGTMKPRFDMGELKKEHVDAMKARDKPFYGNRNADASWDDIDILDFYGEDSLLIRHFEDTEGKIIGFIGFAGREEETYLTEEELQIIHLLLGSFSKEIAVREYKEREVRASNTLGSIMNNMGVDIYVNSFESHDMLYANRSMAEPYGGIEHFWGKKCWEALYSDKTGECEFCPKRHLIDENGHPTKVYSWDYQRPFDKCWFRVFSAAFAWVDGQMAHVITSVDIDHQKKIEEELRVAKDKAEHLDRLKSAFLANMSHEIRTPLNAIVGFSGILASTEEEEEKQEYVSIIENNNTLLLQLISDILDLSKIEAGTLDLHYSNVEINDLMRDLENSCQLKLKSDAVKLEFVAPAEPCFAHIEKNRLSQLIINLVTNAIKFTVQGSIRFGYERQNDELYFYVTDTGCGIPQDKQESVFGRFIKLNSFAQGTGLGLSICQTLVDHMGGKIGVESEEGNGSTFWFTLPYKQAETVEKPLPKDVQTITIEKDKLVILIAEDNESNYKLFESILKYDYHLIHAWDGQEAVNMFKEHNPQIILMDINMPVLNGYEAAEEIRKYSAKVPIIAITAFAYASDEQRVMESGFDGYMPKPINARQLKAQLTAIMQKRIVLL